jgi:PII-like signaling protein
MAKKKSGQQRPFRSSVLERLAVPELCPRITPAGIVWRYTIVVPLQELKPKNRLKATLQDINALRTSLVRHFRGLTTLPSVTGYGLRDPRKPAASLEMNTNMPFVVYAAPIPEADAYFLALQSELQRALAEGVILIERQEVILL